MESLINIVKLIKLLRANHSRFHESENPVSRRSIIDNCFGYVELAYETKLINMKDFIYLTRILSNWKYDSI